MAVLSPLATPCPASWSPLPRGPQQPQGHEHHRDALVTECWDLRGTSELIGSLVPGTVASLL